MEIRNGKGEMTPRPHDIRDSKSPPPAPANGVSNLAAKMAHELNNPLDAVLRFVSLAQRKAKAGDYSDLDRYLSDAQFGLQRMAEVLRELMDIGGQTNRILARTAAVPLADLVSRATRTAAAQAEQKSVTLMVKSLLPEKFAATYDLRIAQVLSNLLKNAVEAAPENSVVRLTLLLANALAAQAASVDKVTRGQGDKVNSDTSDHLVTVPPIHLVTKSPTHLVIRIEDAGPGIPPEILPQLFTAFVTSKTSGAGFGLGLAISRELVTTVGGTLTLENRPAPNTGCLATLTLPLPSAEVAHGR